MNKIYEVIKVLSSEFDITKLCIVLDVWRSAYYEWLNGETYILKGQKKEFSESIARIFHKHKRRYGVRRIREALRDEGLQIGLSLIHI